MVKRYMPSVAGVLAVVALALVGGLTTSAAAADAVVVNSATFTDPAGDASGAPDITNVAVNDDPTSGLITVAITATAHQPASADGLTRVVDFLLNTDKSGSTGHQGADYLFQYSNDPADPDHWWAIGRWDGGAWRPVSYSSTMGFRRDGDLLTWTVAKGDIGGAMSFGFAVETALLDGNHKYIAGDIAPDTGAWEYTLSGPTRYMTLVYWPTIAKPITAPVRPFAGKRLTVTFRVTAMSKPLNKGQMICEPSVAGKVIRHAESFKGGVAKLSFIIPKSAKGKLLRVKITIKAPSYEANGAYIDVASGTTGVLVTQYKGTPTTKLVSFKVR